MNQLHGDMDGIVNYKDNINGYCLRRFNSCSFTLYIHSDKMNAVLLTVSFTVAT